MVTIMSDMFESLELNMREEAERINPTKAIMASQLECEQRFESFVAKNPERVDFLSDDIRSIADKYAAEYDIPSETIYEATVTHLKEAAVKKAELFDNGNSRVINDYIGSNMDLEQIEHYWNQYKPLVENALRSPHDEEHNSQLEGELEHLKEELQGIDDQEEGNEKYWMLDEQITDALRSLYDHGVDVDIKNTSVKEAEWDKPWTEEDESKEENEEEVEEGSEEEKEEDEEEEKKESSTRGAKKCNCWDGYKRVPGTKPCAPGSCEKCDADREKKKAAFILENADDLVPDWIQKNAGWREMLRGFMNRNQFDPMDAPDWSSKDQPLPARARRQQEDLEAQEQPTIELSPSSDISEYEDMIEDQSRAEEKMKENARKRQEMFESEPEYKTRGKHRYEYLRGASVQALEDFYVAQGMPEKTASILVEAVGELAQLQQNEPGLPVSASDPDNVNIDKEIGGAEGDKYRNINVEETSKAIGVDSQEFTDFGDPVREFVQPGGEAPYADNDERTEKNKDKYKGEADRSNMDGKGVKQEDNAPKKSSTEESGDNPKSPYSMSGLGEKNDVPSDKSDYMNYDEKIKKLVEDGMTEEEAKKYLNKDYGLKDYQKKDSASIKEASELSLVPPEGVRSAARRGIKYHSEGKAGDGFESATLARAKKIAEGQELTPEHVKRMHSFFERHAGGRSQKAKKGEITPWDVAWLAWGGDAGRTWAASKVKQMENAKKSSTPLDFDTIDGEVEKLMSEGMTPEQAVQSLGVYNETNEPEGWGGSKN